MPENPTLPSEMPTSGLLTEEVPTVPRDGVTTWGVTTVAASSFTYVDSTNTIVVEGLVSGTPNRDGACCEKTVSKWKGIHPLLYFSYVKKKFRTLEKRKLNARIKDLQKTYEVATNQGQLLLGERFMRELIRETRECVLYAKGIRFWVERSDLWKHKTNIRGGHISDTKLTDFVRVIPPSALKKIAYVRPYFDEVVILHYYNPEQKDLKKMTSEERAKTKDPVAFGLLNQSDRWYFICDWSDEYCDLTFEEIEKVVRKLDIRKPQLPNAKDC